MENRALTVEKMIKVVVLDEYNRLSDAFLDVSLPACVAVDPITVNENDKYALSPCTAVLRKPSLFDEITPEIEKSAELPCNVATLKPGKKVEQRGWPHGSNKIPVLFKTQKQCYEDVDMINTLKATMPKIEQWMVHSTVDLIVLGQSTSEELKKWLSKADASEVFIKGKLEGDCWVILRKDSWKDIYGYPPWEDEPKAVSTNFEKSPTWQARKKTIRRLSNNL